MVRKQVLAIICMLFMACPWSKCGFAQESSGQTSGSTAEQSAAEGQKPVQEPQIQDKKEQGPLLPKVMGDFRDMRMTYAKVKVSDVIDGVTLVIDNKTKVRLSGIWVPWDNDNEPGDTVKKAATLLSKVAEGRFVRLYQTKTESTGRFNRLGQTLAQVERDDGLWLQGVLLYAGLAMTMTTENNPELAARMYKIEQDARKRKVGLWANPRWKVLNQTEVKDYMNEYRIVEGKVFSVAMRNNMIYINFDRNWQKDFSVAIPNSQRVVFARAKVNVLGLAGKTLRIRGWVRNNNGPMIEIDHPQQIEVLD